MSEINMTLLRTVFLPIGSPPIGSVRKITADIAKSDIHVEKGQVYCLGEIDLLIDYICFSPQAGKQIFTDYSPHYPKGGEREWQALLNLPFVLNEKADLAPSCKYDTTIGEVKWFMVAPRALEMEMEIIIEGEDSVEPLIAQEIIKDKKGGGWQVVSLETMEKEMDLALEEVSAPPDSLGANTDGTPSGVANNEEKNIEPQSQEDQYEIIEEDQQDLPVQNILDENEPLEENEPEEEIVKIVFNEEAAKDEKAILRAIEQTKAEVAAELSATKPEGEDQASQTQASKLDKDHETELVPISTEEDLSISAEPALVENIENQKSLMAEKKRSIRSFGKPHLDVEANNNNIEFTAFKINIKLP